MMVTERRDDRRLPPMTVVMAVVRTPVMTMPMPARMPMAMMTAILHIGRHRRRILHRGGDARIDQRGCLRRLIRRGDNEQTTNGQKAEDLGQFHNEISLKWLAQMHPHGSTDAQGQARFMQVNAK